ncbi:MAG: hypothetical protein SGJ10_12885 [Bacteroidota bacterium]|nr:hypothetical protein [Bacteroidota bacterium]
MKKNEELTQEYEQLKVKKGLIEKEATRKTIAFTVLHVDAKDYKFNWNEANKR